MVSMSRPAAVLALLFVAVAAVAEPPVPVVDSITPASGPVTGGTRVTLKGRNFDGGPCQKEQGCALAVRFVTPHPQDCCVTGVGKVISSSDTEIVIETPEHGNGLVDVYVASAAGGRAVVKNGFRFGRGGYKRVLVPVAWRGVVSGAFGSRWTTELTGRVFDKDKSIEVTRTPYSTPPHLVQNAFVFDDFPERYTGGVFIYVPEEQYVDLGLRIRDVSREEENYGTEVPLVTAEETSPAVAVVLLDVTVGPKYRSTLRTYSFEGRRDWGFSIMIFPRGGTEILVFQSYHGGGFPVEEFPSIPGQSQLDIGNLLPAGYTGRVDVQLWGVPPWGKRIWGMISVTNNDTQMVTMVTPTFQEHSPIRLLP